MRPAADPPRPPEPPEIRLKRLRHQSWRRGTREMDLILGPFADARLATLDPGSLDAFEALLAEPDWDLYAWITGAAEAPARHAALVAGIGAFCRDR